MRARILLGAVVSLLAMPPILTAGLPARAAESDGVVKIGVLTDLTAAYSAITGKGSAVAARMAIEDFGGNALGKPIELVVGDHQGKADIGANLAREWYDSWRIDAIFDAAGSSVALAVLEIARAKERIIAFSGVVSPDVTGKLCGETVSSWAWDTRAMVGTSMKSLLKMGGDSVFFITLDAVAGRDLERDATRIVTASGGTILGSIKHPLNNADFSSFLLQAQSAKPKVIALANAGNDTVNAIKQAQEFGLTGSNSGMTVAGMLSMINDIHALGLDTAQGVVVAESFYWNLNDETRAWNKRFVAAHGAPANMLQAAVYSSVLHYLKAVEKAGTDDARTVAAAMKAMPINDFYSRNVQLRADGRAVRDFHLFQVKRPQDSKGPWDYYTLLGTLPGAEAFPAAESECPLLKK
ncbi:ABC transporter substrate-binding protein [Azospirillum sp. HJ39]|uniref:ABC transporter substrate-binding protein n=1 Tax=Azospirillum sp. HJ39 TaxID=3159496 RepID=UPI0035563D5C